MVIVAWPGGSTLARGLGLQIATCLGRQHPLYREAASMS